MRNAAILAAFLYLFVFALAFLGIANDPDGTLDAAEGMVAFDDFIIIPIKSAIKLILTITTDFNKSWI